MDAKSGVLTAKSLDEQIDELKARLIVLGFEPAFFDDDFLFDRKGAAVSLHRGMFTNDYRATLMPDIRVPSKHQNLFLNNHSVDDIMEQLIHRIYSAQCS